MFGSAHTIGNDILDIGSQKFDRNNNSRAIGTGGICPPSLILGEPGKFDVPNVPDVSVVVSFIWFLNQLMMPFFLLMARCFWPTLPRIIYDANSRHTSAGIILPLPAATVI